MKRSFLSIVFIISLLFSLSGSIHPVQAGFALISPDIDQDGILNDIEVSGWYHQAGGPYKTNPNKADSDQDGLTDAEEKLFNTNPNDLRSPGISVKYDSAFKTFEYYRVNDPAYLPMVQGGNRYLLTNGLVVRRGTSFKILAINSSSASLSITGSGMSSVTPVRDPARGGWKVSLPAGGTVGAYTATITDGSWTKSIPIYVVFELPTDMTQAQLNAFVYDDNPLDKRDEVAVWWRVHYWPYYNNNSSTPTACPGADPNAPCSNWQYHVSFGFAQAFWTEQFTLKVLRDFTIPAIQGRSSVYSATEGLATKADRSVRVNYSLQWNSFSDATDYYVDPVEGYGTAGGACETNAGVFTALLRSAGIPARPFNLDYNKVVGQHGEQGNSGAYEYDHAVMMWIRGSGDSENRWYAERTSPGGENEFNPSAAVWSLGFTTGLRPFDEVGLSSPTFGNFRDIHADLVQSVNEKWDWQNGSLGGGMVNRVWPIVQEEFSNDDADDPYLNRDFKWDSKYPLAMDYQSPYLELFNCQLWQGDDWAPIEWTDPDQSNPAGRTARQTYYLPAGIGLPGDTENWPFNPRPFACSPSAVGTADCTAFLALMQAQTSCAALPGQAMGSPQAPLPQDDQPAKPALNTSVQLGAITGDAGVDRNGDGLFDELAVDVEVTSDVEGEYQFGGWMRLGEERVRAETTRASLLPGTQTVRVIFDGQIIGDAKIDGPYLIEEIWVAPAEQAVSKLALPEEMTAQAAYTYTSRPYLATEFTMKEATIGKEFSYIDTDQNGNGMLDSLSISVPLNINMPGEFKLEGDLYDGNGEFVGHAEWTGNSPDAVLDFQITGMLPPYSLEHLSLQTDYGKVLDSRYDSILKVDQLSGEVDLGGISFDGMAASAALEAITVPSAFSVSTVDTNSNGRGERLVVSASVNVTGSGGNYWMEGLLVDSRGIPAAWGAGTPKALTVGTGRVLQMTFDGRQIFERLPLAGAQKFTLIAVKVYSGTPANAVLEASVPVTNFSTPNYTRAQMEPVGIGVLFEDDLESGVAKWSESGAWDLTTTEWNSGSHTYGANGSGTLTIANPLNLSIFSKESTLVLQFRHAHNLGANSAQVQISTNGGASWTTLQTYTGMTGYWNTERIDINEFSGSSSVRVRFNIPSPSGSVQWYVDDVAIIIGPYAFYVPYIKR